jgi:hypothetical protein
MQCLPKDEHINDWRLFSVNCNKGFGTYVYQEGSTYIAIIIDEF